MLTFADTHCHLDFEAYQEDREEVLGRARVHGVVRILAPGIDLESSRAVLDLAEAHPEVYAAVGVHPNSADRWTEGSADQLRELASHPKVKAIGEIGLDYYRNHAAHSHQKDIFRRQLRLAKRLDLPVILHVRNAHEDDRSCIIELLGVIKRWREEMDHREDGTVGVLHSFSGNRQEAQRAISLGFLLGITGPVTFQGAEVMRQVVSASPLGSLIIETDGPFLTPHPHRGKRNEPAYVRYIAQEIGHLKDRPVEDVSLITTENAERLFQWSN